MPSDRLAFDLCARQGGFRLEATADLPLVGITAVSGPSGAGKTTLLRALSGLDRTARGTLRLGDETWLDSSTGLNRPPYQRAAGLVFQDARLFPHLSVAGNLDYAARRARSGGPAIDRNHVIEVCDIAALLPRRPAGLSGGEAQRVALARSLLGRPRLLLLDEPVSALGAVQKARLLDGLRSLLRTAALPALYVSHSLDETARLADRVLPLQAGRSGALESLDVFLARSGHDGDETGPSSLIRGRLAAHDAPYALARIVVEERALTLPGLAAIAAGEELRLRIRARDVSLALSRPDDLSIRNALETRILAIIPHANTAYADIRLALGRQTLMARITRAAADQLGLRTGQTVWALVKSASLDPGR